MPIKEYYQKRKVYLREYQKKYWHKHQKYQRKYYLEKVKNNPKVIALRKLSNIRHRLKQQRLINYFKNKPCQDCQMFYPSYVMQFDHRNPEEKLFTIANEMGYARERLINEIHKCDVVCANCHMERTHKRKYPSNDF